MAQKLEENQARNRTTRRQTTGLGRLAPAGLVFTEPVVEFIKPPPDHDSISRVTRTPETTFNCRAVLMRNGVIIQEKVYKALHDHSEVRHYDGFTITIDCQPA